MEKTAYEMLDDIDKLMLSYGDRSKIIATLKWAGDLLREAGQDVSDVQDCIVLLRSL
ncbi:hypothetical protein UFOVP839_7 [uncultured Caudovirales phage]|uniref:Uncharacterized protein n=1 Tax=uncultured Caudovirales phage TaxID=2100421 RepID=A0A6J5SJI1_9CAUD|nr:hypothetical protein UFOVP839_7 [uncultured Caudovirales phage]CAB4183535.1 hypothetical protein UFOVP1100_9 [uncultured Caudovirales phage]CAB4214056.1 hypothetical protein UFOVP1461_12 [uncultured Caudovirales phage]CAB4219314.1 hypothetical protein UFOVP1612_38 [uncultured Caudovirales phage]